MNGCVLGRGRILQKMNCVNEMAIELKCNFFFANKLLYILFGGMKRLIKK